MGKLTLQTFHCGPLQNNVYKISRPENGKALLIDASPGSFSAVKIADEANAHRLQALLLTHGHWDHMAEAYLFQREGVPIYAAKEDEPLIAYPECMHSYASRSAKVYPCRCDHWLENRRQLTFLGESIEVIAIHGHTPGGLVYYFPAQSWAFCGDSIFRETIGRSDFPGGDGKRLLQELAARILTLPEETILFPGHGPSSTVGHEKHFNPYFSGNSDANEF